MHIHSLEVAPHLSHSFAFNGAASERGCGVGIILTSLEKVKSLLSYLGIRKNRKKQKPHHLQQDV
jgi:hypothetical protein